METTIGLRSILGSGAQASAIPEGSGYQNLQVLNAEVSRLAPYSGMVIALCLVFVFCILPPLEHKLLPLLYRDTFAHIQTAGDERIRRNFINHHIAGGLKIILLLMGMYPFVAVAFGSDSIHSSFDRHGGLVTHGDVLVVCMQLASAMYVFELFYRYRISPIGALHHMGVIMVAQTAISISMDFGHGSDATVEFVLCFVWGAFDVVAESWPHVAMILYRTRQDDNVFLIKVFRSVVITEVVSTIVETGLVMWLFGSLWDRWTLAFKIATPILHVLFSAAQLWNAKVFLGLWKSQKKALAAKEQEGSFQSSD